jgi:hypothetical protein
MELIDRFKLIADEFANEPIDFLNGHLTLASEFIGQYINQPLRDELIVYLAAHRVDQSLKRRGASGQVTSVREGSLAVTYSTGEANSEYDFSSYGKTYRQLVKEVFIAPMTRMCR